MNYYVEALGWCADALFIIAYYLVSSKQVDGEGAAFNLMNLAGALLYGGYAIITSATPVFILECFWGGIALNALWKLYRQRDSN